MRRLRALGLAMAAALALAAPAAAETHTDRQWGFTAAWPSGWVREAPPTDPVRLRVRSTVHAGVSCNLGAYDSPPLAGRTPAEIDASLTQAEAERQVRNGFPTGAQVESLAVQVIERDGRRVISADIVLKRPDGGLVQARQLKMFGDRGRVYGALCGGEPAGFAAAKAEIEAILASFSIVRSTV